MCKKKQMNSVFEDLTTYLNNKLVIHLVLFFLLFNISISFDILNAQTTFTWNGGTGNWNTAGNWSKSGGTSTSTWPGQNVNQNDIVIVNSTGTVTINVAFNSNSVQDVSINTGTVTGNNVTCLINGNLSVASGATFNINQTALTVSGATSISGNLTDGNNTGTNTFAGLVTINSGGNLSTATNSVYNFNGGVTNNGTFNQTGTGNITLVVGTTFTNNATATISGSLNFGNSASTFVNGNGASLAYFNTNRLMNTNGTLTATASNNTITYSRNGAQDIINTDYFNLVLAGNNTKTIVGTTTVDGTLTFGGTATLAVGANTMTADAVVRNNAITITISTGIFTVNNDLTLNVADPITFSGAGTLNVTGNLTCGTLTGNTGTINIGGDFSPNAYIINTSTVNANGTTIQTLGPVSYYNLQINGGGTKALSGNTTFSNSLTLNSGFLQLGNYNLTIPNNLSISGTIGSGAFIETNGTGVLIKQGTSIPQFAMIYPVGSGGSYTPVQISSFSATGIISPATISVRSSNSPAAGISGTQPLNRHWVTSSTNFTGSVLANIRFTYALSDVPVGKDANDYEILYNPSGSWIIPLGSSPIGYNPIYSSASNTLNATWSATISEKKTFYSLISGDWDNSATWTLDPSGTQPNNPSNLTPTTSPNAAFDEVVILSGRTVTVNSNSKSNAKLTVLGILNLGTSSGHSFTSILGSGKIRLAGDQFPAGDASDFVSAGQGEGTVEYYGNTFNLSTARTFYNLDIAMTAGNSVFLLSNYTINGNLNVNSGTLSLNNSVATNALTINILGNVSVGASGIIRTGSATARHQLNLYGNFTNNGDVQFTNRVAANYTAEATDGIVDVNFLSSTKDQSVLCNGPSNFYRIEIDKGTDDTYVLNLDANQLSYFNLFGFANENHGSISASQLTNNLNALGLIKGTVRIGNNINIPQLNNSGNYNISESAMLWVDGGTVTKAAGVAIVNYGKIKVSAGILNSLVSSGITLREKGFVYIQGGTTNINQLRTSVISGTHIGGYIQTDGTMNILGGLTDTDYYTFCLTYNNTVFNMSGGTLKVLTSNGRGSVFINSAPENINVTGGHVIVEANTNQNPIITSTAPFWNLSFKNSSGTSRNFVLQDGTLVGATDENLAAQPLKVLNDFRIWGTESGGVGYSAINFRPVTSTTNVNDVYIGGSFYIENGASYSSVFGGTSPYNSLANQPTHKNTTHFYSTTASSGLDTFYYGNSTGTLELGNIEVNRSHGSEVRLVSAAARALESVMVDVNGNISVFSGTLNQHLFSLRTWGSITNNDRLGTWYPGTTPNRAQIQFADNPAFTLNTTTGAIMGNVQFNVTPPSLVTLTSDIVIERVEYVKGLIYLKKYNLKIDELWNMDAGLFENATANSIMKVTNNGLDPGCNSMIFTNGKASDKGLTLKISGNTTVEGFSSILNNTSPISFPIGFTTDGGATLYFRPAQMKVKDFSDDGYVTIRPVSGVLTLTDITGGELLQHYYRVSHAGFSTLPNVAYRFYYRNQNISDVVDKINPATQEINYVPGKVLDQLPYTRSYETHTDDIIKTSDTRLIVFNGTSSGGEFDQDDFVGFLVENANYTAGQINRFAGSPQIFYSRRTGGAMAWNDGNNWSLVGYDGAAAGDYPQAGDVARIKGSAIANSGGRHWYDLNGTFDINTAEIFFDIVSDLTPAPWGPRIQVDVDRTINSTVIRGRGTLYLRVDATNQAMVNADIGDFANTTGSVINYVQSQGNNSTVTIPSNLSEYPRLDFEGESGTGRRIRIAHPATVNYQLAVGQNAILVVDNNVSVKGNIQARDNLDNASIEFGQSGSWTLETMGNLNLGPSGGTYQFDFSVQNSTPSTLTHTLKVHGNVNRNVTGMFDLYNGTGTANNAILELSGTSDASYNYFAGTNPDLYRIVMNKGTDKSNTFTFNNPFTLNGSTNATPKAIELRNGTLVMNHASISFNLTTGGAAFEIPQESGLEMKLGAAFANGNSGILLDGLLKLSGGSLDMSDIGTGGDNFIEYSASGFATIEVSNGTLTVGSQVRRNINSNIGILKYIQSGGSVIVGRNQASIANRGVFEILNSGSKFIMTGGDLYIARAQTAPTLSAFYFNPEDITITSSANIHIGHSSTPASQIIGIYAAANIPKLRVNNTSGNNPIAKLEIVPATITQLFEIDANATFNANGLDLHLEGNMNVLGNFQHNNNNTYFDGSSDQTITGNGSFNFYNLTKTTGNNLILNPVNTNLSIGNKLSLQAGTFTDNGNTITVLGDCENDATHIYGGSGDGIYMNGTQNQNITGNGTFGKITINNLNGINVPVGNQISIANSLKMMSGVIYINKNLLSLLVDATIEQASPFTGYNMIETNISFTDNGVKKVFPSGSTPNFIFPIGSGGKYTPVTFNITANGNSTGSVTVKPANEMHPGIVEDTETSTQIVDKDNALQYYWTLKPSGINAMDATVKMQYASEDLKTTAPYTSADYINAMLRNDGNGNWNKFNDFAAFDETNRELNYSFTGATDNDLYADYTAGAVDIALNGAIPDNVIAYTANSSGNWSTAATWTPNIINGPRGAIARIPAPLSIDITTNAQAVYLTEINGTLNIGTTHSHRLGIVEGNGRLHLEAGELPAGVYDQFFSGSGGTVEFSGSNSYDVLGNTLAVNHLTFTGSGEKRLPNNKLDILGNLLIDGAGLSLNNYHNQKIEIKGNFQRTSATFNAGTGSNATVIFSGTLAQQIQGAMTASNAFNNLEVKNNNGISTNADVEIKGQLKLTSGLINTGSNNFTIKQGASVSPANGLATSFVNGTLTKEMLNGQSFSFPVGNNASNLGTIGLLNVNGPSGLQNWRTTYTYANPNTIGNTDDFLAPVNSVSETEYWRVQAPTGGGSKISIRLDGSSDIANAHASDLYNLRVVGWDPVDARWEVVGSSATVSGTNLFGTVSTSGFVNYGTYSYFTLASVTPVVSGTASITSSNISICNGQSTSIVVSLTGTSPWTITYTANGNPISSPVINSSPYTFAVSPTTTTTYTLTAVTAGGIAGSVIAPLSQIVTVNPIPVVSLSSSDADNTFCLGTNITFTATAGLSNYQFRVNGSIVYTSASRTYSTNSLINGQSVDVVATHTGGCSNISNAIANTVISVPAAPISISGSPAVCSSTLNVPYNIVAIPGASSYIWTVPSGASIDAPVNTAAITVDFGTNSGNITARGSNTCGNGPVATLAVIVSAASPVDETVAAIGGSASICEATVNSIYTVSAVTNATAYIWKYSGTGASQYGSGTVIDNGSGVSIGSPGTIAIDFAAGATSGTLSVTGTNGCSTQSTPATYAISINPKPTATINPATPSTCENITIVVNGVPAGGSGTYTTHLWTGTGVAYLNNVNAQSPDFNSSTPNNYTITYTVTDNNGCVGSANATATVYAAPMADAGSDLASCNGSANIGMGGASATGSYSLAVWTSGTGSWSQNPSPENALYTPTGQIGSTIATLTLTGTNGCPNATDTRTINWGIVPSISLTQSNPEICTGTLSAGFTYSGTSGNPDQYSIDYSATAEAQTFIDVSNQILNPGSINAIVPGTAAAGTYIADLTLRYAPAGCVSVNYPVNIVIKQAPVTGPLYRKPNN